MKVLKATLTSLSFILLTACASQHATNEKINNEVKSEPVVKRTQVRASAHEAIMNSKELTTDQKNKLFSLQETTTKELQGIEEQINKTKMVLIKTLMDPKSSSREIAILKKDLRKLSKKQMEVTLNAFDKGRNLIAPLKDQQDREDFFNTFMARQNHLND
jgi:septal ring factor EnvC (AmiA/AmiB activator)